METVLNAVKKSIGITPSPDDRNRLIRLAVQVQPYGYGYGKKGSKSMAARLALGTLENNFEIDEEQTYGEVNFLAHTSLKILDFVPLGTSTC
jgi:hypothetical protein